jgi:hypothetical protein
VEGTTTIIVEVETVETGNPRAFLFAFKIDTIDVEAAAADDPRK